MYHELRKRGTSLRAALVRGVEVELDQHIVRIMQKDLPAGAVRHRIDAELHTLAGEMLLDGVETTASEGDVVNDAGIRRLRLVGRRDVVEVQYRTAFAVEPRTRKVERRPRPALEAQHLLV